jgi:hypothetical protein
MAPLCHLMLPSDVSPSWRKETQPLRCSDLRHRVIKSAMGLDENGARLLRELEILISSNESTGDFRIDLSLWPLLSST